MSRSPAFRAALWMSGSIASFSLMAIAGKQIGHQLDSFEIMTARSAIGFCLVLLLAATTGRLSEISADRLGGHLLRNLIHFTGQNLWFWALTMIPLAQLFALEFTQPIWVILLSPLLLGEHLTRVRALSALLGFIGVIIVARPDLGPSELTEPDRGLIFIDDRVGNVAQLRSLFAAGYKGFVSMEPFNPAVQQDPDLMSRLRASLEYVGALLPKAA